MAEMKVNRDALRIIIAAAVLGAFILIVVGICYLRDQRVTEITFTGTEIYTEEELYQTIFDGEEPGTVSLFVRELVMKNHVEIPYIDHYKIRLTGMNSCEVKLTEKDMIGCVSYMGGYMYFDRDGLVVESTSTRLATVPMIEGLGYDHLVLGETIEVEDPMIFEVIRTLDVQLAKYGLMPDSVGIHSDGRLQLGIGQVTVELGTEDYLEEKIARLSAIWSDLDGLSGSLDMEEYDGTGSGDFVFHRE